MRTLLTTILLSMLHQPALADLVYYCETIQAKEITRSGVQMRKLHNFKFVLTDKEVKFRGGYLDNRILTTTSIGDESLNAVPFL